MRKVLLLTVIFDRMIFAGRDESEQHLRGEHFEEYKSLFARECFLKTRHHEKYREWEAQEVYIEGLTFCNLDEMETHGQKVQNKGANGEESGDKETQAMILVMVVDQNGKDFAKLKSYKNLHFPQKKQYGSIQ